MKEVKNSSKSINSTKENFELNFFEKDKWKNNKVKLNLMKEFFLNLIESSPDDIASILSIKEILELYNNKKIPI